MFNEIAQLKTAVGDKKNILITFRQDNKGDSIASALALGLFLEKMGKNVEIVCQNFVLPRQLKFLKKSEAIKSQFSHLQKFVLTVDTAKTGVEELSYDLKDNKLRIFVTPKQGFLNREDVRTAQSDFKYEIIFILDTPNFESLGTLYDNNTELFYKRPVINIDYSTLNEQFGQINLVDHTATSTAEVVFDILQKWQEELIDIDVATALLAGMISNTNSFKTESTKPQTLNSASKLIHLGANRDYIIQNLYRTRSLSTLKLWGQALSHLQYEKSLGLVWTTLTRDDFARSGSHENELYEIIDEIIATSPEAKIILLIHEHDEPGKIKIHAILNTSKGQNALSLLMPFKPSGNEKTATCLIEDKSLNEVEEMIIENIKKITH